MVDYCSPSVWSVQHISSLEGRVAAHQKPWQDAVTGGDVQNGRTSFQFAQSKGRQPSSQWHGVSSLVVGSLSIRRWYFSRAVPECRCNFIAVLHVLQTSAEGPFHSSCRCEENGGVGLAALESCGGENEVFLVDTSSPTLALLREVYWFLFIDAEIFGRGRG